MRRACVYIEKTQGYGNIQYICLWKCVQRQAGSGTDGLDAMMGVNPHRSCNVINGPQLIILLLPVGKDTFRHTACPLVVAVGN